jgi:Mg2+/citrate symporter
MHRPTASRVRILVGSSTSAAAIFYGLVGITGYVDAMCSIILVLVPPVYALYIHLR